MVIRCGVSRRVTNADEWPPGPTETKPLSARHGPDHEERFASRDHSVGERRLGIVMRDVLFAGEKSDEWATFLGCGVSNRSQQYGVATLQCVEHRALAGHARDVELDLAIDLDEGLQVSW